NKPSKPKRESKKVTKKPKVITVTSDNTPVVSNDDAEPVEALDVVEKQPNKITVACPYCNKMMAPKTLKIQS
ncbi:MAG: hypothetical protein ACKPKO_41835, partial [Candidatus Fonsibacter sp.]